jgi:hypothetical protein
MKAKRVVPIFVTAACALGAAPAATAATDVQQATSANWSGYVVGNPSSGQSYSSVSGSWVEPAAKCTGSGSYSAFWVGLGGSGGGQDVSQSSGSSLEQAGTEVDCSGNGTASHFAWYELVPDAPVKLGVDVHAGDKISTKVSVNGQQVNIWLSDDTTGQSATKTLEVSSADTSSAEWIAEAPSTCQQGVSNCTPLPLTDFGTVQFSGASATTTDGHTGTISDSDWSTAAVNLAPSSDGVTYASTSDSTGGATPSSLSSDGSSFSVAWSNAASSTSTGSGYPYGYGGGSGYGSGDPYGSTDPYGYGGGDGYGGGGYGYGGGGYGGGGYGYGGGGYAIVVPGIGVVAIS